VDACDKSVNTGINGKIIIIILGVVFFSPFLTEISFFGFRLMKTCPQLGTLVVVFPHCV
jgi:hypothetical protein